MCIKTHIFNVHVNKRQRDVDMFPVQLTWCLSLTWVTTAVPGRTVWAGGGRRSHSPGSLCLPSSPAPAPATSLTPTVYTGLQALSTQSQRPGSSSERSVSPKTIIQTFIETNQYRKRNKIFRILSDCNVMSWRHDMSYHVMTCHVMLCENHFSRIGWCWRLDQHDHPQCWDQSGHPGHLQAPVQPPQPGGEDQLRGHHPDQEQGGLVPLLGYLRLHHLVLSPRHQRTVVRSVSQQGRLSCEGSQHFIFYRIFYNYHTASWRQ